mmetsp:Transcript_12097/g.28691  ORF Transcript_12097/g.28691 Transcript_12097/m.28691 type:complete len:156 (-) Transcript_12097:1354-1821(-)
MREDQRDRIKIFTEPIRVHLTNVCHQLKLQECVSLLYDPKERNLVESRIEKRCLLEAYRSVASIVMAFSRGRIFYTPTSIPVLQSWSTSSCLISILTVLANRVTRFRRFCNHVEGDSALVVFPSSFEFAVTDSVFVKPTVCEHRGCCTFERPPSM